MGCNGLEERENSWDYYGTQRTGREGYQLESLLVIRRWEKRDQRGLLWDVSGCDNGRQTGIVIGNMEMVERDTSGDYHGT